MGSQKKSHEKSKAGNAKANKHSGKQDKAHLDNPDHALDAHNNEVLTDFCASVLRSEDDLLMIQLKVETAIAAWNSALVVENEPESIAEFIEVFLEEYQEGNEEFFENIEGGFNSFFHQLVEMKIAEFGDEAFMVEDYLITPLHARFLIQAQTIDADDIENLMASKE